MVVGVAHELEGRGGADVAAVRVHLRRDEKRGPLRRLKSARQRLGVAQVIELVLAAVQQQRRRRKGPHMAHLQTHTYW